MVKLLLYFKKTILHIAKNKGISLLACFLVGALGAIPYYCEELFIFTFISLFALFYIAITQRRVHNRTFLPFFMYFCGFYSPLYLFLAELYPYERFNFSESQATLIVICSCIFIPLLHATVESLVMLVSKFIPSNELLIIGYASLWVAGEWVLTLGNMAFPWGNIAVSLTGFLPFLQTASLFGKYFIAFITVIFCCSLVFAIKSKKRLYAFVGLSAICLNTFIGTIMWYVPSHSDVTVKAAAIQGNVLSNQKWDSGYSTQIFERYINMTAEAAQNGAELIIVPESAIPFRFKENGAIHSAFSDITAKYGITVIAGINYYEDEDHYNSVIGISPNGALSERYDKRHLVPFGEFIPLVDLLGKLVPFVGELSADSGSFSEGNEPVIIDTEYGKIAPLVCFDSIFSQYANEGVDNGADALAIVTNDSWFNDSIGIYTHLRHAQLRAIETGKYVMRAANTGISAFINEQGKILSRSDALTEDVVYSDIHIITDDTLYSYIGDVVLYISFAIIIVLIIHNIIRRFKNGKNTTS